VSLALCAACTKSNKKEIWIYTSTYKEVLALYEPQLKKDFPDVDIQWFQAGSEDVAARVNAELTGGGTKADLIMTSDLFYFRSSKSRGSFCRSRNPKLSTNFPRPTSIPTGCSPSLVFP
jgi:iron(III) transport system substrate-binding protein